MRIKLKFLGAAQNVTGSRHFLQADGTGVLVDCGLYQERQFRARNWDQFPIPPADIDAVLLTHAHLDHCGLLPKLVREGYNGKIYCTPATAEIAKITLLDSAKLQEEDAEYKSKRHKKEGREGPYPVEPLYNTEDAQACFPHFSPVKYQQPVEIDDNIQGCFYDAGHILGSSIIKAKVNRDSSERIVLFTGDIGRPAGPIVRAPASFEQADYLLIEATYGDRVHKDTIDIKEQIGKVINSTVKRGGKIIIPSFALERSQEVLFYINELLLEGTIPRLKIFLDSPMASSITKVFQNHPELFGARMAEFVRLHESPFDIPGLQMAGSTEESKAINDIDEPIIIIAGSGMCTGGRIKHHLVNGICERQNTIMFVGYQAIGTLGRQIVDDAKEVRILGQMRKVKAKVVRINGFSAHADRNELLDWLENLKNPPRGIFVVHGESESAKAFGDYIREKTGWQVTVPAYQDEAVLE